MLDPAGKQVDWHPNWEEKAVEEPDEAGIWLWRLFTDLHWQRVDVTYIDGTDILECPRLSMSALDDSWKGMWLRESDTKSGQ